MRRLGIPLAALVAVLATPAAAGAATTYTVDPNGPSCASGGFTCRTFGEAAARVQDGDTVNAIAGAFSEGTVTFSKDNLTINGAGPFATSFTVTGTGPAFAFTGQNARLNGIFVVQSSGAATDPAISATKTFGLADAVVVSTKGPALTLAGGAADNPNVLIRVGLFATADASDAVQFTSASDNPALPPLKPAQRLVVDSSIFSGGAQAAGLLVKSGGGPLSSNAAPLTVDARHLTIAGSAKGIVADASEANGTPEALGGSGPAGSIAVNVADSIVLGASDRKTFNGSTTNTADITFTNSDTTSDPAKLFVSPGAKDFHLRADASAVDAAGTPGPGESDRDVDGDPRVVNGKSDRGADEFSNKPPAAVLKVDPQSVRQNRSVGFDASGSTDPEAASGGGIASYRWDFGDGTVVTTAGPVTDHSYAGKGSYQATVTVVDRQGGVATSTPTAIQVTDGVAPVVGIASPTDGQLFRYGRPIVFKGTATDESGIKVVDLALRLVKRTKAPKPKPTPPKRRARAKKSATADCRWFDGRRTIKARSCGAPLVVKARLSDRTWSYRVPRTKRFKLPRGNYELYAQGVDRTGLGNTIFNVQFKTLIHFRVR